MIAWSPGRLRGSREAREQRRQAEKMSGSKKRELKKGIESGRHRPNKGSKQLVGVLWATTRFLPRPSSQSSPSLPTLTVRIFLQLLSRKMAAMLTHSFLPDVGLTYWHTQWRRALLERNGKRFDIISSACTVCHPCHCPQETHGLCRFCKPPQPSAQKERKEGFPIHLHGCWYV